MTSTAKLRLLTLSANNPHTIDWDGLDRVIRSEPRVTALIEMVAAFEKLVRRSDRLCNACVWELIVKPLLTPLVGWSRKQRCFKQSDKLFMDVAELVALESDANIDHEATEFMRSSEAWDAISRYLLARLWECDPGNGHGIGRREHEGKTTTRANRGGQRGSVTEEGRNRSSGGNCDG